MVMTFHPPLEISFTCFVFLNPYLWKPPRGPALFYHVKRILFHKESSVACSLLDTEEARFGVPRISKDSGIEEKVELTLANDADKN